MRQDPRAHEERRVRKGGGRGDGEAHNPPESRSIVSSSVSSVSGAMLIDRAATLRAGENAAREERATRENDRASIGAKE